MYIAYVSDNFIELDDDLLTMSSLATEATNLPNSLKGKKRQIAQLLIEGKLSDEQIAERVCCKVQYVWNTRTELKKAGFFTQGEAQKSLPETKPETQLQGESTETSTKLDVVEKGVDETKLTREELRILYKEFLATKKLAVPKIIAKHGFSRKAVEPEYRSFTKYKETDMEDFQARIMKAFVSGSSNPKLMELEEIYESKGYLKNDELIRVIDLIFAEQRKAGLNSINYAQNQLPDGWMRGPCRICGIPFLFAIIVNYKEPIWRHGLKEILQKYEELICSKCDIKLHPEECDDLREEQKAALLNT